MEKQVQRGCFLFGAGAAIDWGGPKTLCNREQLAFIEPRTAEEDNNRVCCLTHLILATGFRSKSGERVTREIYLALLRSGYKREKINFETIINVIEEIIVYYSNYSRAQIKPSLLSIFFDPKLLLDNFLNYEIVNRRGNTFQLKIPEPGKLYEQIAGNGQTPEQFFFQLLLVDVIDGIYGHVSKYGCYTENIKGVVYHEVNAQINQCFSEWILSLTEKNIICRMYTLNYDRIFKILIADRGVSVIEGFTKQGKQAPSGLSVKDIYDADINEIVKDENSHCHFNLHGCSDWIVSNINEDQLQGIKIMLGYGTHTNFNDEYVVTTQMENGKSICVTGIITGYQKAQKTALMPYKQMQAAFDRDCLKSEILFIVGYSFGDEHINESIKAALQFNHGMRIVIVDSGFNNIRHRFFDIISVAAPFADSPFEIDEVTLSYDNFNTMVHRCTFKEFLTLGLYKNYISEMGEITQ